jgi:hypothetical protein
VGANERVVVYLSRPPSYEVASSFYRPRGGGLQSCRVAFGYIVAVLTHGTCDLMVSLANFDPYTRRGGSCSCLGVTSRVVMPVLLPCRRLYTSSRVRLTGGLELHSGRRGSVPSARALTMLGMASQCPGWWHNARDGRTGSKVTEGMCPAGLTSRRHLGRALSWWQYAFRGRRRPFSRVAAWRKERVGGTVQQSDTGHPAQHSHIIGDGGTTAGCLNNAGIGFPGCVRRSAWRAFAFDPGTHGASEHLMPRSGEQAGHCGRREAPREAETRSRGRDPRARRELV